MSETLANERAGQLPEPFEKKRTFTEAAPARGRWKVAGPRRRHPQLTSSCPPEPGCEVVGELAVVGAEPGLEVLGRETAAA